MALAFWVAGGGLPVHVCLPWVLHSGFRAFYLSSMNGERCGSGFMVVAGGLLFHVLLLRVLHLGSVVRAFLH